MSTIIPCPMQAPTQSQVFEIIEGDSQCERILYVLRTRRGNWVSMPQLATAGRCFAVHSRIAELRGKGWPIENRITWAGKKRASWYRMK